MGDIFGVPALLGYAIGTAQILMLDWVRNRTAHLRQLRLLRAELKRAKTFNAKFGWKDDGPPKEDVLPRPPSVSGNYLPTLSQVDFTLTDETQNDNSQEAMIGITDACRALQHYHDEFLSVAKAAENTTDSKQKPAIRQRAAQLAQAYDREVDRVQFILQDATRDVDRRLRIAKTLPQLARMFRRLPYGENLTPISLDDPRLISTAHKI